MDIQSTKVKRSDEELFPPNLIELMGIMNNLMKSEKDKDENLFISVAMLNPDESNEESMNNPDAPFDEVFNMPLIDETLEFAKTKAATIKDISDFVWERLPEIEITDEDEEE